MLLTIDQLLQKQLFFSSLRLGGYEFQVMFGSGFFAKVLQHVSGGMHPKAHDQASV